MSKLTLICPDDWHLHVRDGNFLRSVVPHSARQFARAIIMPNLQAPVTTVDKALEYRQRILEAVPIGLKFDPLMTLYMTDHTTRNDIIAAAESPFVQAIKLYPAGATTHSELGVARLSNVYPLFDIMEKLDIPLLIHGEVTDHDIDIFDRERVFVEQNLADIIARFPCLRIVLEHVTTLEAVQFIIDAPVTVAATITAHHLLYNRNAFIAGGIHPHYYCLPILKREKHRQALVDVATSGNPKFFLGTDSAPHPTHKKESSCGCAGCYTANAALEMYTEVFDNADSLDKLEGFASIHGATFYRLPINEGSVTLKKKDWIVPDRFELGEDSVVPLRAGENLTWRLVQKSTDHTVPYSRSSSNSISSNSSSSSTTFPSNTK